MVSLIRSHSLCPGCRLFNKHRLVPPSRRCVRVCGVTARDDQPGDCVAWLLVGQGLRTASPSLLRGPWKVLVGRTFLAPPPHTSPFLLMPAPGTCSRGRDRAWGTRAAGGTAGGRGPCGQDTAGCSQQQWFWNWRAKPVCVHPSRIHLSPSGGAAVCFPLPGPSDGLPIQVQLPPILPSWVTWGRTSPPLPHVDDRDDSPLL